MEARGADYYMANIKSFLLQEPEHYIEFRKYVRNIIDWGKDKRLKEIRDSLDGLLEESRKRASEAAKSRQPPSDGSATSSGKRRKSNRTDSVQGRSEETDGPYWDEHDMPGHGASEEPSFPPDTDDNTVSQDEELALADYLPRDGQQGRDEGLGPAEYVHEGQQDQDESDFSSEFLPPTNDCAPSSKHKRKALSPSHASSRRRSRAKDYWTLDNGSGEYFHKHSDGTITWLEGSDDTN
ncbi:hypothetical protein B0T26DRAFT_749056 [Lasiosphaeria miniovina]|uniref:Uncharacterized protein n=1 Tax=Lasiosphaeria miniovina TaxID=1954250 RepID=A0AA40EB11_9PEZI|nr:uncharacterized protein B0T26DRAFT_749056 [Lasiosphaeria miniovina]KAK0728898.1 hypothetical protein B0T26DRAFT_749056 [Lasiosphaeria miniovina]